MNFNSVEGLTLEQINEVYENISEGYYISGLHGPLYHCYCCRNTDPNKTRTSCQWYYYYEGNYKTSAAFFATYCFGTTRYAYDDGYCTGVCSAVNAGEC